MTETGFDIEAKDNPQLFSNPNPSPEKMGLKELFEDEILLSNADQKRIPMPAKHIFHQPQEAEPKPRALLAALEVHHPKNALITCKDDRECELLAKYLSRYGYRVMVATIDTPDLDQSIRLMLNGSFDILICQCSSINGHSLENVPFMINYDMFDRAQSYEQVTQFERQAPELERKIVSILTSRELGYLGAIKAQCLIDFEEMPLPAEEEVLKLSAKRILEALKNEASFVELGQFELLAQKILEDKDAYIGLSLLLRNHFSKNDKKDFSDRNARQERYSRNRRPERTNKAETPLEEQHAPEQKGLGISRLYITLGRKDGFSDLASLAQFLSERSGVDLGHFSGGGMIRDTSAHIEVDDDVVHTIIAALNGSARPHALEGVDNLIICEMARQAERPLHRRPPHNRRRSYQRR